MKLKLKELIRRVIPGFCLVLSVLHYSCGTVLAYPYSYIPSSYTIIAKKNYVGTVTDIYYKGDVINTNEVPVGNHVSGSYTLARSDTDDHLYVFESYFTVQGISQSYNMIAPGLLDWGGTTFSSDHRDLYYEWMNGFPGNLDEVYFTVRESSDGGAVSFDIKNYASDVFKGTGNIVFYESASEVNIKFTVTPVPEPSTILLISGGLLGLVVWRRKTRNNKFD